MSRFLAVFCIAAIMLSGVAAATTTAHVRTSHGEPLNDLTATPGATLPVTLAALCTSGYPATVRHVPDSEKNVVYAEYGITHRSLGQYEVDHLISLELGGSNVIANLWPELNDHPPGYLNSKDRLENKLHSLVCKGSLPLASAQHLISTDWVAEYHSIYGVWPHH